MEVTVELSAPPKGLSPNARVHWRTRAALTSAYRAEARLLARSALVARNRKFPLGPTVTAEVDFRVRDRRRRDGDNHLAMLKAAWDGFKDAGLLSEDHAGVLTIRPPTFTVDKGPIRVIVRLTEGRA